MNSPTTGDGETGDVPSGGEAPRELTDPPRMPPWATITLLSLAAAGMSAGACYLVYALLGIPLFPSGAVGWVLALAPVLAPLAVCPALAVPAQRAGERTRRLLREVETTRSELAAEVAERKAAQARLEELARRDPLTGLLNRRGFFELWSAALDDDELLLLSVDVDDFKTVNDEHGHAVGDQVLVEVATALEALAGDRGRVARVGGDEFVVTVPSDAVDVVRRAQEALTALRPPLAGDAPAAVSASVGWARLVRGASIEEALHVADLRMYAAKRATRPGGSHRHGRQAGHRARTASEPVDRIV
jgi:diguanylate cyclase (GGDEF)-like protein